MFVALWLGSYAMLLPRQLTFWLLCYTGQKKIFFSVLCLLLVQHLDKVQQSEARAPVAVYVTDSRGLG